MQSKGQDPLIRHLAIVSALVLLFSGLAEAATSSAPEPRIALVIGNSAYSEAPLANPANDARLMGETLRDLGFEVIERIDVDQRSMRRLLRDFGEALDDAGPDSVGLFYFSGHGLQVRGRNFMLPTNAVIRRESDVRIDAVGTDEVLEMLALAENRLNIVILDACRNNPYAKRFKSQARGLARMDAPRGTLVAYATAPGTVARDGEGANSPYTLALARVMRTPGVPAEQVFKQVRDAVMAATKGEQVPWEESSLTGADFYFSVDETGEAPAAPAATEPTVRRAEELGAERDFWSAIDSTNPAMFEAYLRQFPDGTFAELARLKLDALRKAAEAAERKAEERRLAEKWRRAEEKRLAAQEATRRAKAAQLAEERRKAIETEDAARRAQEEFALIAKAEEEARKE